MLHSVKECTKSLKFWDKKGQKSATTTEGIPDRAIYANYAEFILSCIGYSVGLGNIWRFPHLAYKNGGGAFLIPYWISVIIAGLPFYFLELAIGLGWAMFVVSLLVSLYYDVIIAWVLYYLFYSLRTELLWSHCRNEYNNEHCFSSLEEKRCKELLNDTRARFFNKTCWNQSELSNNNVDNIINVTRREAPADQFFNLFMLNISDSFENVGVLQWRLVVALAVSWILVFLCLYKGIESSGKAVYVTATFPYVVLFILLIRGGTLPGAVDGILFYVTPRFDKLIRVETWIDAATQVFYSLGPAFGGIITMGSYMPFKNNCERDAIIVSIVDTMTSMIAGCAIFSIMGFMAHDLGVDIQNVTKAGPGLAFIAYPEAIVRMPLSPIWAVLFFLMMFLLGLDSEFSMLETCTTSIIDQNPKLRPYKTLVIFIICVACFIFGLLFCTNGGIYYFTAFDDYSAGYSLLVVAICECIVICYCYGIRRFIHDIHCMLGRKPNIYWIVTWCAIAPLYMLIVMIFTFTKYEASGYGDYTFHAGAEAFGWIISLLSIILIPIMAIYQIIKLVFIQKKNWRSLFKTSPIWCPANERSKGMIPSIDSEINNDLTTHM